MISNYDGHLLIDLSTPPSCLSSKILIRFDVFILAVDKTSTKKGTTNLGDFQYRSIILP